jgi:hypothetical protein
MGRWILALPLIAMGVSFGDGAAASVAGAAAAGTSNSAARQTTDAPTRQPKSAKSLPHRHHFAQRSKPAAPDSLAAAPAKTPPAFPPPLSTDDEGVLTPRTVSTIRVPAPAATPSQSLPPDASRLEASADLGPRLDEQDIAGNPSVLADKDDTRVPALTRTAPPSPLTAIELLMLFGACGGAAIGCYGLVALSAQRRTRRVGPSPPPRRSHARSPSASRDRNSDRVERQRLFPHQFGAAIRSG